MSRLAALARRLRPSSRRRAVTAGLVAAVLVAVLGVGLVLGGAVFAGVYGEYGFHPEQNARDWAALTPVFSEPATCQRCHATEHAEWQAAKHSTVACESCHGPLANHAATAPADGTGATVAVARPSSSLCASCHEKSPARPAAFPQVDLAEHFANAEPGAAPNCIACHDAHSLATLHPPEISHPLERLPACVTCHRPNGLKPVPGWHVESTDAICLSCHKRPAGQ